MKEKEIGDDVLTSHGANSPRYVAGSKSVDEDGNEAFMRTSMPYTEPTRTWLVCPIEVQERFCQYIISGPFNNDVLVLHGIDLTESHTLAMNCLRLLTDSRHLLSSSEPATILRIRQEAYTQGNESIG